MIRIPVWMAMGIALIIIVLFVLVLYSTDVQRGALDGIASIGQRLRSMFG